MESTEHVTVIPADLYDEMMAETLAEPCMALQEATQRLLETAVRK